VDCLRLETLIVQVGLLAEQPSVRLLKHIVRCYLRLSDNPRAREALRQCLPDLLRSPQFTACLKDDPTTCRCDALSLGLSPHDVFIHAVRTGISVVGTAPREAWTLHVQVAGAAAHKRGACTGRSAACTGCAAANSHSGIAMLMPYDPDDFLGGH
jgi:Cell differentiation family, Rcd1-like